MRLILAIVAGMLLCSSVSATPLDSSISGVYLTPDRVCNLVVSRPPLLWQGNLQTWWVAFDLKCLTFAGQFRQTRVVQYVYTGCPSYGAGGSLADYGTPPEFISIRAQVGQNLDVVRSADQMASINGYGPHEVWYRIAPLASPAPYSCAGSVFSKPGH